MAKVREGAAGHSLTWAVFSLEGQSYHEILAGECGARSHRRHQRVVELLLTVGRFHCHRRSPARHCFLLTVPLLVRAAIELGPH